MANIGGLAVVDLSDDLAGDIIVKSVDDDAGDDDDLFMRDTTAPGLTRRRSGERRAKPDADGRRDAAIMATIAKVTEVKRRFIVVLWLLLLLSNF